MPASALHATHPSPHIDQRRHRRRHDRWRPRLGPAGGQQRLCLRAARSSTNDWRRHRRWARTSTKRRRFALLQHRRRTPRHHLRDLVWSRRWWRTNARPLGPPARRIRSRPLATRHRRHGLVAERSNGGWTTRARRPRHRQIQRRAHRRYRPAGSDRNFRSRPRRHHRGRRQGAHQHHGRTASGTDSRRCQAARHPDVASRRRDGNRHHANHQGTEEHPDAWHRAERSLSRRIDAQGDLHH